MQDELTTILGVKVSPDALEKLKKFKAGLQQVSEKFALLGKASMVAGTAIGAMMKLAGDASNELKQLSDSTGVSTTELQQLEYASKSIGVSFDSVKGDIQSLTSELNNPLPNQFNEGLTLLGISTRDTSGKVKSATDVFGDLSDKLANMSTVKAIEWGKKVGISADTVKLLKQGKAGLESLKQEGLAMGAIVPEDAVNGLASFSKSMSALSMVTKSLVSTFLGLLAPAVNKIVDAYKRWSISNGGIIKSGMEFIAKQIAKAFEMIGKMLSKVFAGTSKVAGVFKPLAKLFKNTNVVASALTVAIGALCGVGLMKLISILRMVNPWLIVIAVLVEELYTWFTKGFESTGFFKLWQVFEKKFPTVAGILKQVFGQIKTMVLNLITVLKQVWDIVEPIGSAFLQLGAAILNALKPIGEWIVDGLIKYFNVMFEVWSTIVNKIFESVQWLLDKLKTPAKTISGWISKAAKWLGGGSVEATVKNTSTVPSNASNSTVNTNNNQKITGTTNVYVQAGNLSANEVVGAVKQQYGNSTNITSPVSSTGGALVQ